MKFRKYLNIRELLNISSRQYENIKTILLWVMVITSLLLTYSLWTYNPSYEMIKNQATVESVQIDPNGKLKNSDLIRPLQLIYYSGGDDYLLVSNKELQEQIYDRILEIPFSKSSNFKIGNTVSLNDPSNFMEFIFPVELSQNVIKELLHLDEEQLLISDVDRVYLYETAVDDIPQVYLRLISYEQKKYIDLNIQLDYEQIQKEITEDDLIKHFNYFIRDANGEIQDVVYLPTERIDEISHPIKFVRILNEEDFKNALFGDPSFVNREAIGRKINYTDGKQVLSVSLDTHEITYRSIVTDNINQTSSDFDETIQSIQFVNKHYGWTDKFILFDEINSERSVFRLVVDGLPVLNDLSSIQLRWDKGYIYEYNRSLIDISYDYPRDFIDGMNEEMEQRWPSLMSGFEVIDLLKEDVGLVNVKNILIGYEMKKYSNSSSFYEFVPNWYYYNGDRWIIIEKETGGDDNGLEEN